MSSALLLLALVASATVMVFAQDTRKFNEFIDTTAKPCEDFYAYACGKWTPKNSESQDVFSDQRQENRKILKNHFDLLRRQGVHNQNQASKFYSLCLNSPLESEKEILSNYIRPIAKFSQWPYVNETFDAASFDWLQVAAKLRRYQVDSLFQLSVQRNWKDSSEYIVYITGLKKPWTGSLDGDDAFVYKTYMKYILLDFKVKVRQANSIADAVLNFVNELSGLKDDVEDALIDPIPLSSLIEQFPKLDWEQYFKTLLGKRPSGSQLVFVQTGLLKKIERLLKRTDAETIALYQLERYLYHYQYRLDPPNWIDCVDEVNNKLPLSVSKIIESLDKTFTSEKVRQMFHRLQEEFIEEVSNTSWYSAKSKENAIDKLEEVRAIVGISDADSQVESETEIELQTYEQARIALDELLAQNEFDQLENPMNAASKNLKPLNVNAYYKLTENTLEIPIGLLRQPLYREDSSTAQVMGSLGSMFGHELVHGFDYDGQNYDSKGNVKDDVNPKEIIQFGLRANCFMDQYSGARVAALNEDIADNAGMRLSYGAFEKMGSSQSSVDGAFNAQQLFFISYAQIWCRSKEATSLTQSHSANKDRVNNVVANSEKFAEAFSCPVGSHLNPVKKCKIW